MLDNTGKITESHLQRDAYLYVRQSTLKQVIQNTESTKRQYALRDRAVVMGWPREGVVVIDDDLGQSGASSDRDGFKRLVADVGMGSAGIVMGLEVSRLARNSSDWHRLLELCAMSNTLILDEDGLYDPNHFNDRILLGLKGQMSEIELHLIQARLRGGILNQARRGELKLPLPTGLVYDALGRVVLEPDQQVQQSIRTVFACFERTHSVRAVAQYFRSHQLNLPVRVRSGPHRGELAWREATSDRVGGVLHNPRYAGAFAYGRYANHYGPDGQKTTRLRPHEEWTVLLPDAHPGYIDWARFEANEQQLRVNARVYGQHRNEGPPREGAALLQGIAICGRCGQRMSVRYNHHHPIYQCVRESYQTGTAPCQRIPGSGIDHLISELLMQWMTPNSIALAIQVQDELQSRDNEVETWHDQEVQRAQHEADLAQQRYRTAHPNHRLVADVLEADWNAKLQALDRAQTEQERQLQQRMQRLNDPDRQGLLALAQDFPRLWRSPDTPHRERKRMVRLLIEDVTLTRTSDIHVGICLRGGTLEQRQIPPDLPSYKKYATPPEVMTLIKQWTSSCTDEQIAQKLNEKGLTSGRGLNYNKMLVRQIREKHHLGSLPTDLRARGWLTRQEMATQLGVSTTTVSDWSQRQFIDSVDCGGNLRRLYRIKESVTIKKHQGQKLAYCQLLISNAE